MYHPSGFLTESLVDADDLQVFLAAWREGSVSKAAARLGVGVSTASRRIDRLEEHLGRPLFVRTASGLAPLPAAEALRPHAEEAERALLAGAAAVESLELAVQGRVTVALPSDMVQLVLLPHLPTFVRRHPEVELVFRQGSGLADLMRREADIAVRVVQPTAGEELVATRLRPVAMGVFGSRRYFEEVGRSPDPLAHRWVSWDPELGRLPEAEWLRSIIGDRPIALRSSHVSTIRLAAAAGVGLALMPQLFGHLTPTLEPIALDVPDVPPTHLWMVTHRALRHAPRVAATWDHFVERLREKPEQDDVALLRGELAEAYGLSFAGLASVTTPNHSSS